MWQVWYIAFLYFSPPGMKKEELKWIDPHQFSWCDSVNACCTAVSAEARWKIYLRNSGLETSQLKTSPWKQAPCSQPGNGAAGASFSWRCLATRARLETQAGLEVLARKKKKSLYLSAPDMWSLRHPYSPVIGCFVWNMFLGILSLFCLYTGGSSNF